MRHDLLIRDATLIDGTGATRIRGDLAVSGDRIAAMGDLGGHSAEREVDAAGLVLAPGFIDAHMHDDRAVLCGPGCMLCKMSQGATTVVVGGAGRRRWTCLVTRAGGCSTASAPTPTDCGATRRRSTLWH